MTSVVLDQARRLFAAAGDLLLGAVCPGCDAPGLGLCADCRARVLAVVARATRPAPTPTGFPLTVTCAAYEDPFRYG